VTFVESLSGTCYLQIAKCFLIHLIVVSFFPLTIFQDSWTSGVGDSSISQPWIISSFISYLLCILGFGGKFLCWFRINISRICTYVSFSRESSFLHRAFHRITLITNQQMHYIKFHIKTLKIAPTCFDPEIILRELRCSLLNSF